MGFQNIPVRDINGSDPIKHLVVYILHHYYLLQDGQG